MSQNTPSEANAPRYLELERQGELARRETALFDLMESCHLCPRNCAAQRTEGEEGTCSLADTFKVASHGPHHGEERVLVGRGGSGTIFFSHCSLLCAYCQNWEIAHAGQGQTTTHDQLAGMMLSLQERGCHNINLVTPTHLTPHIVRALRLAIDRGLRLPLVYNTGGYDSLEALRLLDGVIDIYMPDFKYQDSEPANLYSAGAADYPRVAAEAIKEMHRQVGYLRVEDGLALRGLMIRHLVLPNDLAGTARFVQWVADELGTDTAVNIMGQYSPHHLAHQMPEIARRPTQREIQTAMELGRAAGLRLL